MQDKYRKVFEETGRIHGGISAEAVRAEIQHMIDEVFLHESEKTLALWSSMASNGEKPTPEELFDYCIAASRKKKRRRR